MADNLHVRERRMLGDLGGLVSAPSMMPAEGVPEDGIRRAVFFDGLPWKNQPTKVFAWMGIPQLNGERAPGVVLVHGGGGTAFREWVQRWNDRGYAAISIAVEGQTDRSDASAPEGTIETGWNRHAWSGPSRKDIFGDAGEPFEEQWMYHAVAATVLAHSLLRDQPGVDADKIGLVGVSWGGVIASTVMGIDARFAFAIPIYGCGHLHAAENRYGRALRDNILYRDVWNPVLRFANATMPSLWYSWPGDEHFPLDCQRATYRAVGGPHMVALVPGLGHGHKPAWAGPEPYAFADAVVKNGRPWTRQVGAVMEKDVFRAVFQSQRDFESASLVWTRDRGETGRRVWTEAPAGLARDGDQWVARAPVPEDATGWFINFRSGDLVVSTEYAGD